jgi:LacI family transcriptional regulator
MANHKVNIKDIAKKSGLSTTTVSRVLNGKAEAFRISKVSQEKVLKTAKELNYVPNQYASNLRSGKSNTIALMVPSLNNPFFAEIASRINTEIRQHGYITIISDSNEDIEIEKNELRQLLSRNIEGLIIVPCGSSWKHIEEVQEQGLPIICIDRYFEDFDVPFISTDNYEGAYLTIKELISMGHKRITCIQGVPKSTTNVLRVKGYLDALEEAGITWHSIVGDDFTIQNGYLETKLLLQLEIRPTVIFTLSNTIAIGCMKALKEENLRIPEDISLITFDDHPYLEYLSTPLSCISQPVKNISKIAVKFLFRKLNNEELQIKKVLLKPQLKMRESVKRLTVD